MKSILFTLLLPTLLYSFAPAQEEKRCGFPTSMEEKAKYSYFFDYQEKLNQEVEKLKRQGTFSRTENDIFVIPVIVHVIHNGEPIGTGTNISAAQIQTQIDVLNEDFSNNNPYKSRTLAQFRNLADDTGIRFVLASYDASGNLLSERGIRRLRSPNRKRVWTPDEFDREIKPMTIWDPTKYLNIWTVDSLRIGNEVGIGYSSLPDLTGLEGLPPTGDLNITDGVVIRYNRFGSAGKIDVPQLDKTGTYTYGRTTTHEIGHFLGLLHPFESGNCSFDGDYCPDTPLTSSPVSARLVNSQCDLNQTRCNGIAMVQNFMDYGRDTCMTLFTKDQIRRMRTVLQTSPRRIALTQSVTGFIDRVLSSQIIVYPNPASNQVRIAASDIRLKSYQIYNLQGQKVIFDKFDEFSDTIDVSRLPKGMYLLQIETQKGNALKKIMIE
jgi:hypothetical protein